MDERERFPVQTGRTFIVSDLHIQTADAPNAQRFLTFLRRRVATDPDTTLVIAGDLFDFWYATPGGLPGPLAPIVEALAELPRVVWIEGNHDLRLERGLPPGTGIEVRRRELVLRSGPLKIHVQHGDLVRRGGRWTRRLLQSPVAELGARVLGPSRTWRLGNFVARRRHGGEGYDGQSQTWLALAMVAAHRQRIRGFDLSVMGHGHFVGWFDEGLVCLGDWLRFFTYLELDGVGGAELRRFDPDQESLDEVLPGS